MKKLILTAVAVLCLVALMLAQANYSSFRDTGAGLVTNQPWCFEGTQGSGQDVCMKRATAGHIDFQTGTGAADPDVKGTCTLGTNCAITFATAYGTAPVCVGTDQTAAAAVKSAPLTTGVTFTGTGTDVIAYVCLGK